MQSTKEFRANEDKAETEIATAIKAAKEASGDEVINGLGPSNAVLYLPASTKSSVKPQYKNAVQSDEKPLLLTYFAIIGLGEVPKLLLAESQMPYDCIACIGGEDQSLSIEWRSLSPNGLLPMLSGAGVPRSSPISQSGAITRFLAKKIGMNGENDVESALIDVLFETCMDLNGKKEEITAPNADKDYSVAKGPFALGKRIEKLLRNMPSSPKDENSALNYGQIQLFHVLESLEARKEGCVKENLGHVLDAFRIDVKNRASIKEYLNSPARFPWTNGELGGEGYNYATGPLKRGDIM